MTHLDPEKEEVEVEETAETTEDHTQDWVDLNTREGDGEWPED